MSNQKNKCPLDKISNDLGEVRANLFNARCLVQGFGDELGFEFFDKYPWTTDVLIHIHQSLARLDGPLKSMETKLAALAKKNADPRNGVGS
jgi:hypothetical protein